MTPPAQMTLEEAYALVLEMGSPPKFERNDDLYGVEGPRAFASGMLPHRTPEGEIHAWIWDDGLMLVSKELFELL